MALQDMFGGFNWQNGRPVAQANTGRAPSYDMNTQGGVNMMNTTMSAMGAGRLDNGVGAFMPVSWSEIPTGVFNQGMDGPGLDETRARTMANNDILGQLFHSMGKNAASTNSAGFLDITRPNDITQMYQGANNELKDYWRVRGGSSGWDGKNNERSIASTTYRNDNGVWNPISAPQYGVQPKNPGWIKGEGADFVGAMSMMLPAVGGWAGLANMAAPGAMSGVAGAIGNGATNALVNAAGSALMGGGTQGFLSSLVGGGLSSGASSLMNGQGLSGMFGGNNVSLGSPNNFNSLSQYLGSGSGQALRSSAPMRGEMGQAFNTGRTLSSLFGRFV